MEIFKEQDPRMKDFAGRGKVFFIQYCTDARASYSVDSINQFFETGHNPDHILERMVDLMEALQSRDPAVFLKYKGAQSEYPDLYQLLVDGLSDETLQIISDMDVSKAILSAPSDMGKRFVDQLLYDKQASEYHMRPEPRELVA